MTACLIRSVCLSVCLSLLEIRACQHLVSSSCYLSVLSYLSVCLFLCVVKTQACQYLVSSSGLFFLSLALTNPCLPTSSAFFKLPVCLVRFMCLSVCLSLAVCLFQKPTHPCHHLVRFSCNISLCLCLSVSPLTPVSPTPIPDIIMFFMSPVCPEIALSPLPLPNSPSPLSFSHPPLPSSNPLPLSTTSLLSVVNKQNVHSEVFLGDLVVFSTDCVCCPEL